MNFKYITLAVLSAVVLSACTQTAVKPSPSPAFQNPTGSAPASDTESSGITWVTLAEQNASGQSGDAVIKSDPSGKAVVTITLTGGKFVSPQPAHIHMGSCPTPDAVKYPLTDIVNGESSTTLDVSYSDLVHSTEKMAINVHQSAKDSKIYTACGDIE